jgi:hypothetical protein
MWVAANDVPRSAGHPFDARLNEIFDQRDFNGYVERQGRKIGALTLPRVATLITNDDAADEDSSTASDIPDY